MADSSISLSRRVLVSGASGLIGTSLEGRLRARGHGVCRLVRRPARSGDEISWDPARGILPVRELEGFDAVVHLAGENVAAGRWTDARKAAIRESRVQGTVLLARRLAELDRPPSVLVSASAIGFYGDRGEELLDETMPPGDGFLARTCVEWEACADPARAAGIRVVHPRIGVVLATQGGALARMLMPFRLGLGGRLGSGRQWMSWIALDDLVFVLESAIFDERLVGPVNAVAPEPVRNADFTRVLARILGRPALAPVPAFALRALAGGLADELLLASIRVAPRALERCGFRHARPTLEEALASLLRKAG
jgi:uncharacterized protein (TIGR01777 family)